MLNFRRGSAVFLLLATGIAVHPLRAQDRLEWFRHDKFGMFIHWGPYSLLAGEWKGRQVPVGAEAEWIMQRFNIPLTDYREMAHGLNPTHFNADEWVSLAKSAGMKYLVITAKHHDGFAMYHSRVSRYNIVDWTPFKRDPLAELSAACRRNGIRFCVYYSHREAWEDPDGYGNNWDFDRSKNDRERYLERKSIPQMKELLTGFGPLGLIWFDRGTDTPEQAARFVKLVRELQPQCLINGRVGPYEHELMGDYQDMNDNGIPTGGLDEYWETPQTLNTTWGYSKFDQQWKTPANVIQRLVEIVAKGGNYLLNIGPMADGTVPAPSVATLKGVGEWIRANGDSIYGASACPLGDAPWGRCTVKGNRVYLHVFSWPGDSVLHVSGLRTEARAAWLLANPSGRLRLGRESGVVTVALPATARDPIDTVVVLDLSEIPKVDPPVLSQSTDSGFHLDYLHAVTTGKAAKRFNRDGGFHIGKWTGPGDSASWDLLVSQVGSYKAAIRYASPTGWAAVKLIVSIGNETLSGPVQMTGPEYAYRSFDLGTIRIGRAGRYTITVHPAGAIGSKLMYLQSLDLRPEI